MKVDEARAAVAAWFAAVDWVGLKLPTGWFGRPYDNQFQLTGAHVLAGRLVLALGDRFLLTFAGAPRVTERGGNLVISGFAHVVWDRTAWGDSAPTRVDVFTEGEVEFVRY
jgi:hypothetical protein